MIFDSRISKTPYPTRPNVPESARYGRERSTAQFLLASSSRMTATLNPRKGFSLIEMLVYLGLLALVLVALVNMLLGMSKAYGYLKYSRNIQTSAVTALDRMVRDIRNAQSVNTGQSTLGSSPGILTLNTTTSTSSAQTLQFYISSGVLRMKQDGGDLGPLTLPGVTVGSLIFRQMSTGISQAVKIEMTLTSGTHTANFYGTAILRDSY